MDLDKILLGDTVVYAGEVVPIRKDMKLPKKKEPLPEPDFSSAKYIVRESPGLGLTS